MSKAGKATRVPKRIAGAKIPKALRQGLQQLGQNEEGRARISEALLAVTAAPAAAKRPKAAGKGKTLRTQSKKPKASAPADTGATRKDRPAAKPAPSAAASEPTA
jgi:hypothetical protein